jgi:uncharacterized membrane protein
VNNRSALTISFAVIAAMTAASVLVLLQLPPGATMPIHWNKDAVPDHAVPASYGVFMAPAMAALLTLVFAVLPLFEPRRRNLESSRQFFHAVWIGIILFMAVIHAMELYAAMHAGVQLGEFVIAAVALLMILIGNYLGKTRSMFFGGVRTPWTLSSEYSWQRTHALAGKLFILGGAAGLAAALALPAALAAKILAVGIAGAAVVSVGMSYVYWRNDPDRAAEDAAHQ